MKVYRGPRTSKHWKETDAKSLKAWVKYWRPGTVITVDGTIDKLGQRHTDLGIEIEWHDIIALNKALAQYQNKLEKESAKLRATVDQLEGALRKIHVLAAYRRSQAPNLSVLADAIAKIADHFASSWSRKKALNLKMRWVRWKSLTLLGF